MSTNNVKNIGGQIFGDYEAVRVVDRDKSGHQIWLFRCTKCGNEIRATATDVLRGRRHTICKACLVNDVVNKITDGDKKIVNPVKKEEKRTGENVNSDRITAYTADESKKNPYSDYINDASFDFGSYMNDIINKFDKNIDKSIDKNIDNNINKNINKNKVTTDDKVEEAEAEAEVSAEEEEDEELLDLLSNWGVDTSAGDTMKVLLYDDYNFPRVVLTNERKDLLAVPNFSYIAHCVNADGGFYGYTTRNIADRYNLRSKLASAQRCRPARAGDCYLTGNVFTLYAKEKYSDVLDLDNLACAIEELAQMCYDNDVEYLAMPRLCCGRNGANWEDVEPIIERAFTYAYDREGSQKSISIMVCYK